MSIPQNDTFRHVVPCPEGSHVAIVGTDRRLFLKIWSPGARAPVTAPIDFDRADELFARGQEIRKLCVQRGGA